MKNTCYQLALHFLNKILPRTLKYKFLCPMMLLKLRLYQKLEWHNIMLIKTKYYGNSCSCKDLIKNSFISNTSCLQLNQKTEIYIYMNQLDLILESTTLFLAVLK